MANESQSQYTEIDGKRVKIIGKGKRVSDIIIYKDEQGEIWTRDSDSLPLHTLEQVNAIIAQRQGKTGVTTTQEEPNLAIKGDKTTQGESNLDIQGATNNRGEEPKPANYYPPKHNRQVGVSKPKQDSGIDKELLPQNMLKLNNKKYKNLIYMSIGIFIVYAIARIIMGDVYEITRPLIAVYAGIFLQVFTGDDKKLSVWVYQVLSLLGVVLYLFKWDTVYYTYYWWWVLSLYFSWTLIGVISTRYKTQFSATLKWTGEVLLKGSLYALALGFVVNLIPTLGNIFFWQVNDLVDGSIYSRGIESFIFLVVVPFAYIKVIDVYELRLHTLAKEEPKTTEESTTKYSWVVILNYVYYMMLFLFVVFILPSYFIGLQDKTLILLQLTRDLTMFLAYAVGIGLVKIDYQTTVKHSKILHKITLLLTALVFINQLLATVLTYPYARVMYWVAWVLVITVILTELLTYTKKGEAFKSYYQLAYTRVGLFCFILLLPVINPWNLSYQYTVQGLEDRELEFVDYETFTNHWALGFEERRRDELGLPEDAEQYYLDPYFSDDKLKERKESTSPYNEDESWQEGLDIYDEQ